MERRTILLSSGAVIATALAGCAGTSAESDQSEAATESYDTSESDPRDDTDYEDTANSEKRDENAKQEDEKAEDEKDEDEKEEDETKEKDAIPGFERDAFEIDSDILRVKEITYRDHELNIRVMLTTSDRDELIEGLQALASGFTPAVHDVEAFFAEVNEITFTLYDEHKDRIFALFVNVRWLREFLDGDLTNDEFVERLSDQLEDT
jgi:ATP-dependent helicase YprA (DUF1998 family)